ncbi:uncharacterized protein DUF72 [Prosthecobacter fusiformis]|uniref:Uncharacterized protein DUF72 n=1 Tax=Prosthecobacter fusiformis TaxID=48464 RepID=A0A4R7S0V5_9BACT|nr:DUF72 domain-containing protein [Prosthecobacter fusiformis]TDU71086.1 uncharacterized protein DUF72 [Prosthecobacter fusiformis]
MLTPSGSPFPVASLKAALAALAGSNVYVGTSSWKYPGWAGLLYDEQRYIYRGKWAKSRFERDCLEEYAEVFKTVSVDAGYYQFPSPQYIAGLCGQVPDGFKFSFKVTDEITARTFPNLPRYGDRGGQANPHFLNADLFQKAFLASCEPYRDKMGVLMFEFSHFHPRDFQRGRDFVDMLDAFLGQLPKGWQYGVEVRNKSLLHPEYFAMLRSHGVTHVLNNWTHMPSVAEQLQLAGSLTCDDFTAARFLLKPGRTFEQAVEAFKPYNATKDIYEEARQAAATLIEMRRQDNLRRITKPSFLFINNRLEGNALLTILAVMQMLKVMVTTASQQAGNTAGPAS